MFQQSLTEIDKMFPNNLYGKSTIEEFMERRQIFLDIFHEDIKPLIDICYKKPFKDIFKYSKAEYLFWDPNHPQIIEFRIRPKNNYYEALQKAIPQPDNPQGPHATGIALSISIFRRMKSTKVIFPPYVIIEFKIWGHEERDGFILFFKNYRRPIELLLGRLGLNLFTSCCFNNLDKYKGGDIIKKLDLYSSNKKDDEAFFSIEKSFNKNA